MQLNTYVKDTAMLCKDAYWSYSVVFLKREQKSAIRLYFCVHNLHLLVDLYVEDN